MDSVFTKESNDPHHLLAAEIRERSTLHWNYRAYRDMPHELLDYGAHIEEIYLKENELKDLPHELPLCCPNLTNLYLYSNNLTRLHPSIGNMKNLTTLDLSRNKLRELPPELGFASSLQTLDLSSNQLDSLPSTIGHLTKLEYLYFVGNQVQAIPSSISHCISLVALYGGINAIQKIPSELGECSRLRELYLNDNLIQSIPQALTVKLRRLETLNLNNNQLEYLPSRPFDSPALKISFHENPRLHHINYILACQINAAHPISKLTFLEPSTFRFPSRGCFLPTPKEDSKAPTQSFKRLVLKDGRSYTYSFPSSIRILESSSRVPSLHELSLRSSYPLLHPEEKRFIRGSFRRECPSYSIIGSSQKPQESNLLLPEVLACKLKAWSTLCVKCCLPLFFEMGLSLRRVSFKKETAERERGEGWVSLHFCSDLCRTSYQNNYPQHQLIHF